MALAAPAHSRDSKNAQRKLARLLREIRACRICEAYLTPRPIIHASATAKLCIVAQAPGIRVHETGISVQRSVWRPLARMDGHRPRRLLRRKPRRDHRHGLLLSRLRCEWRRSAAAQGMRRGLAGQALRHDAEVRIDALGWQLRLRLASEGPREIECYGNGEGVARIHAALHPPSASFLAQQCVARQRIPGSRKSFCPICAGASPR